MTAFSQWMADIQQRTESALDRALPAADIAPARLHEAMRYAVLGGGKRVRPLLVHAGGQLSGAEPERLDRVSCALEMIHAYSLVHDDMPCMDDDVLRRGKPTVHVQFDEATALLVGDALQTQAFQHVADAPIDRLGRPVPLRPSGPSYPRGTGHRLAGPAIGGSNPGSRHGRDWPAIRSGGCGQNRGAPRAAESGGGTRGLAGSGCAGGCRGHSPCSRR